MELEKRDIDDNGKVKHLSKLEHFEVIANTANHGLIAITSFYIMWHAFHRGFDEYQSYHAMFTTLGYQFFMSEAIMALYNKNSLTKDVESRTYKTRVHWILAGIGCGCALFGIPYQIYNREITHRKHFGNTHTLLGLSSGCILILTILSGCSALFSKELKGYVKPLLSKACHNFIACICYILGMSAIISAYITRSWIRDSDPGSVRYIMVWLLSFVMALTLIGPLKSFYLQFRQAFSSN